MSRLTPWPCETAFERIEKLSAVFKVKIHFDRVNSLYEVKLKNQTGGRARKYCSKHLPDAVAEAWLFNKKEVLSQ